MRPTAITAEPSKGNGDRLLASWRLARDVLFKRHLDHFEMEIRVRQVVGLARQTPIHAIGNLGNAAIFCAVFWEQLADWVMVSWFGLFALFAGIQLYRWRRKRSWAIPNRVSRRAVISATSWALIAGLFWGSAAIYAFPQDVAMQVLIAFLTVGLAAGAVASMAVMPIACLAFFIPSAIPVVIMLVAQGGAVDQAMAAMMTLYVVFLVVALLNGFSSFVAIIRAKIENQSLATGLAEQREASRAKSQFLATMSHELRTPLNAIIGFSQLIKEETLGPVGTEEYREFAGDILGSGQQLLSIIGDVLDMSKLDMDTLELHAEIIDVEVLVRDTLTFVRTRAAEKGVTIEVDVAPDLPMLQGDPIRVKQVLLNLLSNAVKFNKPQGNVWVSAGITALGLVIEVEDTGIGMSPDKINIALEPFSQLGDAFVRNYDGIGLGLPLAQGLMKLHGGELQLSSKFDQGTVAMAVFPYELLVKRPAAGESASIAA